MSTAKRTGRPKKNIHSGWVGYKLRDRRIYLNWWGVYENSRQQLGLGDRKAKGAANKIVAHRNSLSVEQVRNIVKEGNKREQSLKYRAEARGKEMEAQFLAFRQMYGAIDRALSVLDTPAYRDLLTQCSLVSHVKRPIPMAMGAFDSSEEATNSDSLQRLAAVLGEAFVRAHEAQVSAESQLKKNQTRIAADYAAPGYSGRRNGSAK